MNEKSRRIFQRRLSIVGIGVLILGFIGYLFASNAMALYELEQHKTQLNKEIVEAKNYSNQLDEEVKQMGTRSYVEYLARKYLGLYYPDEVIVIPVEGEGTQQTVPPITPLPTEGDSSPAKIEGETNE